LEKQQKLHLKHPLTTYIPPFFPTYNPNPHRLTLHQLIHHTTPIPFQSIPLIHPHTTNHPFKKTLHQLKSIQLNPNPPTSFQYPTINYDLLPLIIQHLTPTSYDPYIKKLFK
ncbi:serine hydrolase, partial [Bacillus pumilus]|uniref:serine hydrolase n=1 Tax=Bacillus pumilus TaxID=1408 RepID=UPI0011A4C1E5